MTQGFGSGLVNKMLKIESICTKSPSFESAFTEIGAWFWIKPFILLHEEAHYCQMKRKGLYKPMGSVIDRFESAEH